MLDRTAVPQAQPLVEPELIKAETHLLDNQVPVHVIRAGSQPLLRIELASKSGKLYEPYNGVAHFVSKLLNEGTKSRSAKELSALIELYGAELELTPELDRNFFTLYTLSRHCQVLLPVLAEMFFEAAFEDREVENYRRIKTQKIRQSNERNSQLATRKIRQQLFGAQHPYGMDLDEEATAQVKQADIRAYHAQVFTQQFEIIISGAVEQEHIDLLNQHFGQVPVQGGITTPNYTFVPQPQSLFIEKPESMQSSIRIGCRQISIGHPDFPLFKVLNEILGGYFGSRLMQNIREEKGYTYGIYSFSMPLDHASMFLIMADVVKEHTQSALDEVRKELMRLCQEPVPLQELQTVQNYMKGKYIADINTPFDLADKFKDIHFAGLDYQYYTNTFKAIDQATPENLQALAKKYLDPDNMIEVVVGGK